MKEEPVESQPISIYQALRNPKMVVDVMPDCVLKNPDGGAEDNH